MKFTFALLCIIGVTEALKAEKCCTGSVTTCCPKNQEKTSDADFDEALETIEEDLTDVLEGATPELEEGEVLNEQALEKTKQMFEWMDLDYNNEIDIINEVEQMLDFDISRGEMSNYEAGILRDYFYDAGRKADGTQEYLITFDQLYDYNVEMIESGLMDIMIDDFAKNRGEAQQQAATFFELFDLNSDGKITMDEFDSIAAQALDLGDASQGQIDFYREQMNIADQLDGVQNNEVTIDDMSERFKIITDDGIDYIEEETAMEPEEATQHAQDAADKVWNDLDADFDGKVSMDESEAYAATLSQEDAEAWRKTFDKADALDGIDENGIYYEDLEEVFYNRLQSGEMIPEETLDE